MYEPQGTNFLNVRMCRRGVINLAELQRQKKKKEKKKRALQHETKRRRDTILVCTHGEELVWARKSFRSSQWLRLNTIKVLQRFLSPLFTSAVVGRRKDGLLRKNEKKTPVSMFLSVEQFPNRFLFRYLVFSNLTPLPWNIKSRGTNYDLSRFEKDERELNTLFLNYLKVL